jgi:hyperosmotically inducible protein
MKRNLIGMIAVCALALPMLGHADEKSKAGTMASDALITTKIKAELAKEKPSTLAKVSVDTDMSGKVVLSGTAKTEADKTRAETVARGIKGVNTVQNNIEVKP